MVTELFDTPWTRKHDKPGVPHFDKAPRIVFPNTLEELIELCRTRQPTERYKAAGAHWALSDAAISDTTFIESHDPLERFPALSATLPDVIPKGLSREFLDYLQQHSGSNALYPVHVECGKRIYQLYAELDGGDTTNPDGSPRPESLASQLNAMLGGTQYSGAWGFETLGGAGGQTVVGAFSTGTHGGDFRLPPIADAVMAIHLVADGGKHYWIEPERHRVPGHEVIPILTDADFLRATYGPRGADPADFEVIRDDSMFNAVLVSVGRFGVIYSVVLRAVRQYGLHEERRLTDWQAIREFVTKPPSDLYQLSSDPYPNTPGSSRTANRFLQIAVCLTSYHFFTKNLCGVSKRWAIPAAGEPGRAERVGRLVMPIDPKIKSPRYELAGNSHSLSESGKPPNFLERACTNSNFLDGVFEVVIEEIKKLVEDNIVVAGGVVAAVGVVGGAAGLLTLLAALAFLLALFIAFLAALKALGPSRPSLGSVLNDAKNLLLDHPDPATRAAGVFFWQCLAYKIFESQQEDNDFHSLSYAMMDRHDYLDKSCNVNVDSIEVFFDANSPMLPCFIDALIAFEAWQEFEGKAFVGYASLRFCGKSRAHLGMEKWDTTCAVEVAGLKDVTGSTELVEFALTIARDLNYNAILHWGQRNTATVPEIEARFGVHLKEWRKALKKITDGGRHNGFSSDFTRRTGLEV